MGAHTCQVEQRGPTSCNAVKKLETQPANLGFSYWISTNATWKRVLGIQGSRKSNIKTILDLNHLSPKKTQRMLDGKKVDND